jgi:hypothetical protein
MVAGAIFRSPSSGYLIGWATRASQDRPYHTGYLFLHPLKIDTALPHTHTPILMASRAQLRRESWERSVGDSCSTGFTMFDSVSRSVNVNEYIYVCVNMIFFLANCLVMWYGIE